MATLTASDGLLRLPDLEGETLPWRSESFELPDY
ncbi:hypothetical protein BN2476_300103 [Paraburkholderia piptadeniae]|uniref:Uncharacterized protein n=1 Tax=Paraburkholderia piptadeniae TaxID=1701573 RepID=A0A1N7S2W9_9BURK|nr:hypothetical protein BN2476_300103 [Paraburkholderia piptadeniae]